MEMRPEERAKRMVEVYGWNVRNPLERNVVFMVVSESVQPLYLKCAMFLSVS